jgi:hypothetical protein
MKKMISVICFVGILLTGLAQSNNNSTRLKNRKGFKKKQIFYMSYNRSILIDSITNPITIKSGKYVCFLNTKGSKHIREIEIRKEVSLSSILGLNKYPFCVNIQYGSAHISCLATYTKKNGEIFIKMPNF